MEGLIPLVCRSIKRSRTRRQYEFLSSGTADTFNIQDFYQTGYNMSNRYYAAPPLEAESLTAEGKRHRRHKSLHVEYSGAFLPERSTAKPEKLVRFRSHKMFSCVTGA